MGNGGSRGPPAATFSPSDGFSELTPDPFIRVVLYEPHWIHFKPTI